LKTPAAQDIPVCMKQSGRNPAPIHNLRDQSPQVTTEVCNPGHEFVYLIMPKTLSTLLIIALISACSEDVQKLSDIDSVAKIQVKEITNYKSIEMFIYSGINRSFLNRELEIFNEKGLLIQRVFMDSIGNTIANQYAEYNRFDQNTHFFKVNNEQDTLFEFHVTHYPAYDLEVFINPHIVYFFHKNDFGNTIYQVGYIADTVILDRVIKTYDSDQNLVLEETPGFYRTQYSYNDNADESERIHVINHDRVKQTGSLKSDSSVFVYNYIYNSYNDWIRKEEIRIFPLDSSNVPKIVRTIDRKIEYFQ